MAAVPGRGLDTSGSDALTAAATGTGHGLTSTSTSTLASGKTALAVNGPAVFSRSGAMVIGVTVSDIWLTT